MRESGLILPHDDIVLSLNDARLSEYGRRLFLAEEMGVPIERVPPPIRGAASFSDAYETKLLEHITGKVELALVTATFLALTTVVPTDSSTGSTITEASYTGYGRKEIKPVDFNAAVSGSPSSIKNSKELVFAACTAGTSTIIGWAICDKSTTGNVIMWGTCSSTVISTTQTPATVAVEAISLTLD